MISSTLICIPLAFYYQITSRIVEMGGLPIGQTMSYGQMSEIFFMLVMPLFFARLGVKWMLAVGMLAWVLRYTLFSGAWGSDNWHIAEIVTAANPTARAFVTLPWLPSALIMGGILLHGICYDFFFVTGQIYTDQVAPKEIRAQAQGMLVLFTLGLGMFVGAQVAGKIEAQHTPATSAIWSKVASVSVHAENVKALETAVSKATDIESIKKAASELNSFLNDVRGKLPKEQQSELRKAELRAIEWKPLWGKPALFAGVILLVFLALFRNPAPTAEPPKA
jgi:hypothetical protein